MNKKELKKQIEELTTYIKHIFIHNDYQAIFRNYSKESRSEIKARDSREW